MGQIVPHRRPGAEPSQPSVVEVSHPSWCDPQSCTAGPAPRVDDYQSSVDYGRHVSVRAGHEMRLTQAVAPWSTATILTVREDLPFVGVDLGSLGVCLAELGAVPAGPLTEQELAEGRESAAWVPPAAGLGEDLARRYLARRVQALVTEQTVDPLRLAAELRRTFAIYSALTEGRRR